MDARHTANMSHNKVDTFKSISAEVCEQSIIEYRVK